jgi:hypothetical protein
MKPAQPVRAELLAALSQLSQLRPEWRLGQTLANLATTAGRLDAGGVWELEDDEALAAALTLIAEYSMVDNGEPQQTASAAGDREGIDAQPTAPVGRDPG